MSVTAILPVPACFEQRRDAVFAPVAGESVLVRIVRTLASVGDVVVAAAESLAGDVRESLTAHGLSATRLVTADPPGSRAHCLAAALDATGADPHGPVLLHDPSWPLIETATLDRVVSALRGGARVALPGRPVTDSVKAVDERGAVTATVDRSPLRSVQYPRGFDAAVLAQVLAGGDAGTFDELDAALAARIPVTLVEGDTTAMRVELPDDADHLAAVIAGLPSDS